jgi:hypothetical protein
VSDYLVCGRDLLIPGTVRRRCALCGSTIAIAPSGLVTMREHNLTAICIDCAVKRDPDAPVEPPTREQVVEMAEEILLRRQRGQRQ